VGRGLQATLLVPANTVCQFAVARLLKRRFILGATALIAAIFALTGGTAGSTSQQLLLAAPSDCRQNVDCIPGLKRFYHLDPTSSYVPLKIAEAGVQALDDGTAQVAVAFSSNPQLSRPDLVTLRDDRHMISPDHVVPVIRQSLLTRYGSPLRNCLNAVSSLVTTYRLRGLNQEVIDGRLPEAVGGEFADSNGLCGPAPTRAGPRIVVGFQEFAENQTLAYVYAEALRAAGFRVRVRGAGGLRPQTVAALRTGRIDMWPGYSGSLLGFLGGRSLARALARIGAAPTHEAPAQDQNVFVMKREAAHELGISKLSDLARYWPRATAAAAAATIAPAGIVTPSGSSLESQQWAFSPSSVLNVPAAWKLSQGQGVVVAVVDSGADITHPDLAPNIWTNFNEIPGNGIDDDHNGYVDDVHGVDLTNPGPTQNLSDGLGHGTHVAGIIAAAGVGGGVIGIAPKAKIMVVKAIGSGGTGTTGAVAQGIRYAAANGARIINLSLGGPTPDRALDAAIEAAAAANVLVVAAAGNFGRDIDTYPEYPAAIAAPNLIAVASTDPETGTSLSSFSNFGTLDVQVAAPGESILSTSDTGGYVEMSGTSMATPMVSGVAALMASANPSLSAVDLRALLMQTAKPSSLHIASGYVDALRAVLAASTSVGYDNTRPPQLKVLSATRTRRGLRIQAAAFGSVVAIRGYRVKLGGRTVAQLKAVPSPFTINLRRFGRTVLVEALDAGGRVLAADHARVANLQNGKNGASSGSRIGT
jgi:subtilisin family serine protease